MKSLINWRIFLILLTLSILSVFAVFPYISTVQGETLKQIGVPIQVLIIAQLIQSIILFSIAIFVGLLLKQKINFQLPVLEAIVDHKDYKKILNSIVPLSVILGIFTAIAIYVVDKVFTLQGVGISTSHTLAPAWQTLLAAFYGGITEEVLMRLFLMTLFIWIGMKVTRQHQPSQPIIFISIFLAAVIFGLGHLPITAALIAITPLVITRAIVLNGIGGIIFGWLYWKKGLEAGIIAHFTADIILLTVLPMLIK